LEKFPETFRCRTHTIQFGHAVRDGKPSMKSWFPSCAPAHVYTRGCGEITCQAVVAGRWSWMPRSLVARVAERVNSRAARF